jgi:hypothetical protein
MKKLLTILALVAMVSSFSNAQQAGWTYKGIFPDAVSSLLGTGCHGVQVDPDGKVWFISYSASDTVAGSGTAVKSVRIFNSDGTAASFSPIRYLTGALTDTFTNAGRGLGIDQNGNILYGAYDSYFRINYKTGAGMAKFTPNADEVIVSPGVDADGNVYTCAVLDGHAAREFQTDFSFIGNDVDTLIEIGRTMTVTSDGLTAFYPRYTLKGTLRYTRDDKFSPFVLKDTVFVGACVESMNWDKTTGYLWIDGGSYTDVPTDTVLYRPNVWYGYQLGTDGSLTRKDSIVWNFAVPYNSNERPRGIAFSPDGKYAYPAVFGTASYPALEQFVRAATDVKKDNNSTVKSFELSQNYPNPFNPSTEIRFSVPKDGAVSLKVYSILGQEVASLVNRELTAGTYTANFNASRLASGTYIYQIKANGFTATKKMMLMK